MGEILDILHKMPIADVMACLESDERCHRLCNSLSFAYAFLTTEGKLKYINSVAREFFGIGKGELFDYDINKDPNFSKGELASFIKSALMGEEVSLPSLRYKAGQLSLLKGTKVSEIPLLITFFPVKDSDGATLITMIFRKAYSSLAGQPIVLLQRSESAAMLARGVAHAFNNVFASIKSVVALLEMESSLGSDVRTYLRSLDELVARGVKLISDLTSYVRLSEPKFEEVKVQEYFERFVELAKLMAPSAVTIDSSFQVEGYFRIDKNMLDQALFNILHNSIDAVQDCETKTVKITANTLTEDDWETELLKDYSQSALRITFDDSGRGIPPEVYPKIFDPYFSTKDPKRSSGLGLNVSQQIISEHGGIIVAYPKGELSGARFSVYLPISRK